MTTRWRGKRMREQETITTSLPIVITKKKALRIKKIDYSKRLLYECKRLFLFFFFFFLYLFAQEIRKVTFNVWFLCIGSISVVQNIVASFWFLSCNWKPRSLRAQHHQQNRRRGIKSWGVVWIRWWWHIAARVLAPVVLCVCYRTPQGWLSAGSSSNYQHSVTLKQ